nr:ABC transporter ATP-binding protein [Acidobacteriota bacterium]
LDNIVTSTLAFEAEGKVAEYVGGWEDYLRQSRSLQAGSRETPPVPGRSNPAGDRDDVAAGTTGEGRPARRKLTFKEARELDGLPAAIESLEEEQARLRAEAEAPDFYKAGADRMRAVVARADAVARELEGLLKRWVELEGG